MREQEATTLWSTLLYKSRVRGIKPIRCRRCAALTQGLTVKIIYLQEENTTSILDSSVLPLCDRCHDLETS